MLNAHKIQSRTADTGGPALSAVLSKPVALCRGLLAFFVSTGWEVPHGRRIL